MHHRIQRILRTSRCCLKILERRYTPSVICPPIQSHLCSSVTRVTRVTARDGCGVPPPPPPPPGHTPPPPLNGPSTVTAPPICRRTPELSPNCHRRCRLVFLSHASSPGGGWRRARGLAGPAECSGLRAMRASRSSQAESKAAAERRRLERVCWPPVVRRTATFTGRPRRRRRTAVDTNTTHGAPVLSPSAAAAAQVSGRTSAERRERRPTAAAAAAAAAVRPKYPLAA